MAKEILLGLTSRDFEHAFYNSIKQNGIMIVGAVAAALAYIVFQRLLSEKSSRSNSEAANLKSISGVIGLGVGIAASVYAANRLSYTTIVAEKALKFFIINFVIGAAGTTFFGKAGVIVGFICSGGALGYFGKPALYGVGVAGALLPFIPRENGNQKSKSF